MSDNINDILCSGPFVNPLLQDAEWHCSNCGATVKVPRVLIALLKAGHAIALVHMKQGRVAGQERIKVDGAYYRAFENEEAWNI